MHLIRDPSRERNIGDQIVRPAIGIAIGAAAHICDDAGGLREAGPGLAKAQSPHRRLAVENHQPR
jgi:hypothetical protein